MLPPEHVKYRSDSSSEESSYTFGKPGQYLGYNPTPALSRAPSFLDDGRQTVLSHFSDLQIDETDDPAVARSMFMHPPRHAPSLPSLPSASRSQIDHRSYQSRSPSLLSGSSHSPISPLSASPAPMTRAMPSPQQLTLPYTCAFRMSTNGSMVLAPPDTATDLSPLYRVEVFPNVFTPTSYITKVYRGNTILLGQFEMGISKDKAMLYMDQRWCPLEEVFTRFRKVNSRLGDRWIWQRGKIKLHWDCRTESEILCYEGADTDKTPIARFRPAATQPPEAFANSPPASMLDINTSSRELLDEIIMSCLVVERKRTNPNDGRKELFN